MSEEGAVVVGDICVLVVGDSERTEAARETLERAFSSSAVLTARTLADALERLEDRDVHCIVIEPSAEALSSIETISARAADVPIVAITEESAAERVLEAGATDTLSPAAPPAVAASRVRNAVERHHLVSRSAGELYRRILETSAASVLVLDEEGKLQYASPAIEEETGFTPGELERRSLSRFVHPDDREAAGQLLAEVVAGPIDSTSRDRYRLRHADGTWVVHEVAVTNRLDDPAVEGVLVTISRGWPESVADGPLVESVDRLEGAFVALGDRWEILHANEAAERLFSRTKGDFEKRTTGDLEERTAGDLEEAGEADVEGAVAGDLAGTVLWELLPEPVAGTFYERLIEARTTQSLVAFEVEYPPLERWLAVEAHPSATGVTVYARDATVDEVAEQRRDRLAMVESALDALEDGVLVLEGPSVEFANGAAFDLLDVDVLVGRDLPELVDQPLVESIRERADSPVVRRDEPIRTTLRPDDPADGRGTPVAVSVVPVPDENRVVCVLTDERERRDLWSALSTLRETSASLEGAETATEAIQTLVDAVVDAVEADLVGCYRLEGEVLEPAAFATADASTPPPLPTLEVEETVLGDAIDADRATVHDGRDLERFLATVGVRAERVLIAPINGRGVVFATATEPGRFDERAVAFLEALTAMGAVSLGRIAGESNVRERERQLARQEARIERLSELGDRKRAIGRRLVRADEREAIEEGVCEELASVDWVVLAWIGDVDVATEEVTPRARAGDETYLESVTVDVDPDAGEPSGRAAATRDPVVVENVVHEEDGATWRREALERGIGSILSVPLAYDEYRYGTLSVYADRPSAFDAVTQAVFADLGETVAYGINAVETRRALLVDGVTELELLASAPDDPLAALAGRAGCALEVGTVVPRSADRSTVFVTVSDAPIDAVLESAEGLESIESARPVSEDDETTPLELVVTGSTIASTLVDLGGVLRSVSAADVRARLVVELPRGSDVRTFVRRMGETYSRTELVARRERDRPVRTRQGFRAELREALTDRQLRALEAAYYGGFFEWPRERTGEEVAHSLGISQPTFNRHYRAAERKLFSLLFDDRALGDES